MVTVYEEFVEEQNKKEVSERCYNQAKQIWDEAKKSFSQVSDNEPCVVNTRLSGKPEFTFVELDEDDLQNLLDNSCGVDEVSGVAMVVLPIRLQEWYYREPRYSDEYVRYQLCKELEDYELKSGNQKNM